jgi:hypothetical protein
MQQYKYIEHDEYMRCFAMYVLMVLEYQVFKKHQFKSVTTADLIALHHRIEQLPIEDLLQMIDVLVKQVNSAADHYHQSGLPLTQWFKRYWWAPTAIVSTVVIKCFIIYYKHFTHTE